MTDNWRNFFTICGMHTERNIHRHLRWLCLQLCHDQHTTFASSDFACDHHRRCKTHCHSWWVSKIFWE